MSQEKKKSTNPSGVCVIIPVFNRPKLLCLSLTALLKQSMHPQRVILCDDGSTDDTIPRAKMWIAENTPPFAVDIASLEHAGAAAARNGGLELLQRKKDCSFVYFLDSDDIPQKDFLEKSVRFLSSHPEIAGCCATRIICSQREEQIHEMNEFAASPVQWLLWHGAGILSCSLFRYDAVERVGGFDESLPTGHDMIFIDSLLDTGPIHALTNTAVMMNRKERKDDAGNLSDTVSRRHLIWAEIRERIIKKHQLSIRPYTRMLHDRWYQACCEAQKNRRLAEAFRCCCKSIYYRPCAWQAYARLFLLLVLTLIPVRH